MTSPLFLPASSLTYSGGARMSFLGMAVTVTSTLSWLKYYVLILET